MHYIFHVKNCSYHESSNYYWREFTFYIYKGKHVFRKYNFPHGAFQILSVALSSFLPPTLPMALCLSLFLCIAFSLNEEIGFDFGLNTYRCTALEVLSEDGEGTAFQ